MSEALWTGATTYTVTLENFGGSDLRVWCGGPRLTR